MTRTVKIIVFILALSATLAIYRPITRDGNMREAADNAQKQALRCERETALHKRIVKMIDKLKGEKK